MFYFTLALFHLIKISLKGFAMKTLEQISSQYNTDNSIPSSCLISEMHFVLLSFLLVFTHNNWHPMFWMRRITCDLRLLCMHDCAPALHHDETCSFSPHTTVMTAANQNRAGAVPLLILSLCTPCPQSYALYVVGDEDAISTNMLKYLSRLSAGGLCEIRG